MPPEGKAGRNGCGGGGAPFIVLASTEGMEDGLRIDMDELEAVTAAARKLISGVDKNGKEQQ